MKWFVIMTYLNCGMVLVLFGQMASVNECNQHIQHTFFYGGAIGIGLAALLTIASVFMVVVEFVQKQQKQRRACVQAS